MKTILRKSSGFTLVEFTVVIVTLSILFAITLMSYDLLQASAMTAKTKSNAIQAKKIAEIYNSETDEYPNTTQQFYLGGILAKLPAGAAIIADASSPPLNAKIGTNTIAYACATSCTTSPFTGGRIAYWDYASNSTKYIYVGDATSSSTWDYPQKLSSLSSGGTSSCGTSNGDFVYCWGAGGYGQLGIATGNDTHSMTPMPVDTTGIMMNKNIVAVSTGRQSSCALDNKGKAYCWGNGGDGQLGNGLQRKFVTPQAVNMKGSLAGKTIKSIHSGGWHTCAIASDDKIYCWGHAVNGRLGYGGEDSQSSPIAVNTSGVLNGKTIISVDSGHYHTCAVATDGKAYCFGANYNGALGSGGLKQDYLSPVAVDIGGVLSGKTLTTITAGFNHTCALDNTGKAYCWGWNGNGQLGDGSTTEAMTPVAVDTSTVLSGKTLISISAGNYQTCATDDAGKAYCWGSGSDGELGKEVPGGESLVPVEIDYTGALSGEFISSVSTSSLNTCFNTNSGKTACSGQNDEGQLGTSLVTFSWNPVSIDMTRELKDLGIVSISSGIGMQSCGVGSNMRAYCWGNNADGQLGNNIDVDRAVPTIVKTGQLAGKSIKSVKVTREFGCAIDTSNLAYCWGYNSSGQIGNGSSNNYEFSPTAVSTSGVLSGKTFKDILLATYQTCAIASDDLAYCWGSNGYGQLGNGTTTYSGVPVAVDISGVLSGKTIKSMSLGSESACAIASNDLVYCWGDNTHGQLGNNSFTRSLVPVALDMTGALNGKTIKSVSTYLTGTCAVASDDQVYCWGGGQYGELGNGTTTSRVSTPVAVRTDGVMNGKTIKQVVSGYYFNCALSTDSMIFCWGNNADGQFGNNTVNSSTTPVAVDMTGVMKGRTIKSISAGENFACAMATTNEAFCWGSNSNGQFGNGSAGNSLVPVSVFM